MSPHSSRETLGLSVQFNASIDDSNRNIWSFQLSIGSCKHLHMCGLQYYLSPQSIPETLVSTGYVRSAPTLSAKYPRTAHFQATSSSTLHLNSRIRAKRTMTAWSQCAAYVRCCRMPCESSRKWLGARLTYGLTWPLRSEYLNRQLQREWVYPKALDSPSRFIMEIGRRGLSVAFVVHVGWYLRYVI